MNLVRGNIIMSSPVFSEKTFSTTYQTESSDVMTVNGTISRALVLTSILVGFALYGAHLFANATDMGLMMNIVKGTAIAALIIAVVMVFKKEYAMPLSIVYAMLEGVCLGIISMLFESMYNGIVFQALGLTIMVLFLMLFLYRFRIIRVTEKFRSVIIVATSAIFAMYLLSFVLGFFGISLPFLTGASPLAIGINVVVVVIASLNLLLDFDYIEKGAENNLPKYFEWYSAFGLLVTLIWLYLELLRLLAKLNKR